MNDQNKENLFGSNQSLDYHQPLEYGDHLEPPFWGTSNVLEWSTDTVFQSIKKERLFRGEWSGIGSGSETDLDDLYNQIKSKASASDLVRAAGYYGFFPVITDDKLVILLDPSDFHTELMCMQFPEMQQAVGRSISDYFKPAGDVITLQITTIGSNVDKLLQLPGKETQGPLFSESVHGLAAHCSKIVAEKVTTEIRRCFGLERDVGRRFDFGDPGMPAPQLKQQLFELLSVEERLGVELTEQFEMKPGYSLISIFVHHPAA